MSHCDEHNRSESEILAMPGETPAGVGEGAMGVDGPEWFAPLYRDARLRVYNVAARIVGNPDDAADIVQDVFLRVLIHPPDARTLEHPQPWLYRITVNACFDHLRRRTRRTATSLDDAGEIAAPHDGFEAAALTHAVEDALGAINPRYRAALVLRDLQGLETDEVAAALGTSPTTARVLVHRARGAFRKAFRSLAPAGSGALPAVALIAMLPELPLPASLQAVPFIGAVSAATAATAAGTAVATTTSAAASTVVAGGAAAAAAPAALAPVPAAGLLTKLAAAGIGLKGVAVTAAAVTVVAGGGVAAERMATRDDAARTGGHQAPTAAPLHEQQRDGAGDGAAFGPGAAGSTRTGGPVDGRPDAAGKADAAGPEAGKGGPEAGSGSGEGAGDGDAGSGSGGDAGDGSGSGNAGGSQGSDGGSGGGSGGSGSGHAGGSGDAGSGGGHTGSSGDSGAGGSGSGDSGSGSGDSGSGDSGSGGSGAGESSAGGGNAGGSGDAGSGSGGSSGPDTGGSGSGSSGSGSDRP